MRSYTLAEDGSLIAGHEAVARGWIDLSDETPEQAAQWLLAFGLHPLLVRDAGRLRHPAKVEVFEGGVFLLLRGLPVLVSEGQSGLSTETVTFALIVQPDRLITYATSAIQTLDFHHRQLSAHPQWLAAGSGSLALRLGLWTARRHLENLFELENWLSDAEDLLAGETEPSEQWLTELIQVRGQLRRLSRQANYHQQAADTLRHEHLELLPGVDEALANDLFEQYERLHSLSHMHYEISGDMVDAYLSLNAHRLNQTMRVLTLVTSIFVPLGFLAGLYGMNFVYIPELQAENGYFVLLGVMGTIAAGLLWLFRRRRWL